MEKKKTSKLHDIRGSISDASEIMRQLGSPRMLESLDKVKETATQVNEIMQSLKTPEMVQNIENFRLISEHMDEASARMQNTVQQLRETGVIAETTETIKYVKGKIDLFCDGDENGINGNDIHDVSITTKEMLLSIKDLVNELTVTIADSKKSVIVSNIQETIKDASDIYKTTQVN